jgi:hypothetical protein
MPFRSTQSSSTKSNPARIEMLRDRPTPISGGQGRVLSYVPHPLAPTMSSETLTSYWTTSAVNSVALGTKLTSKSADRAMLIRDLLNLVSMRLARATRTSLAASITLRLVGPNACV